MGSRAQVGLWGPGFRVCWQVGSMAQGARGRGEREVERERGERVGGRGRRERGREGGTLGGMERERSNILSGVCVFPRVHSQRKCAPSLRMLRGHVAA